MNIKDLLDLIEYHNLDVEKTQLAFDLRPKESIFGPFLCPVTKIKIDQDLARNTLEHGEERITAVVFSSSYINMEQWRGKNEN